MKKTRKPGKPVIRGERKTPRVIILSGLSGSGKTVALRSVEDLNFFCVDNLPVSLIGALVAEASRRPSERDIAIGIDIREKEFLSGIGKVLDDLRGRCRLEVLFLEAETDVLIRRFKETRRPHPLGGKLEDAIQAEKLRLAPLKENADRVIDTSSFSPHQLRTLISSLYYSGSGSHGMTVALISFGFKYGVPQNIDLLFDVRFLPNPYFVPELRHRNGTDSATADYVLKNPETRKFMKKIGDLLDFLLPLYRREGRSYLSIAIGCTGGNHRSPAIVEEIAKRLRSENIDMTVIHRDIS